MQRQMGIFGLLFLSMMGVINAATAATAAAPASSSQSTLLVFGVVTFCLGIVAFFFIKSSRAIKLNIKGDVRNPSTRPFRRIAVFDKKARVVNIYKGIFSIFVEKQQSYFDPNAFAKNKTIDGYIGISGKEDDDNFVPCGDTLLSGAMAQTFAMKHSDAIVMALLDPKAGLGLAPGTVYEKIKNLFTKDWVVKTFGIIDVRDANLILLHQKIQVADLYTRANEFKQNHLSFLTKWGPMILTGIMFLVIVIGALILWNGTATIIKQNSVGNGQGAQIVTGINELLNRTHTVALPGNGSQSVS